MTLLLRNTHWKVTGTIYARNILQISGDDLYQAPEQTQEFMEKMVIIDGDLTIGKLDGEGKMIHGDIYLVNSELSGNFSVNSLSVMTSQANEERAASRRRAEHRHALIQEELMAAVWSPQRMHMWQWTLESDTWFTS